MSKEPLGKLKAVMTGIEKLEEAAKLLSLTYELHPELNNLQPPSMEDIIPASLDEWQCMIWKCKEDWQKIIKDAKGGE